ncbi:beta-galactosidase [bacterium]|nr:MAG: beta-galactosidase [bacterium]
MIPAVALIALQTSVPRPEHPRPDMMRSEWVSLNGTWQFAETNDESDQGYLRNKAFPDRIVVPFARESKLSGLGRTGFVKNVWYKRSFTVPAGWSGKRVRLHLGASDWRTTMWVNGKKVKEYVGGSSPVTGEVTSVLKPGENTVIVHAFDDTRSGLQPLGKQSISEKSEGIFYTRTTGIWQSVWLEAVGQTFVKQTQVEPDVPGKRFLVSVETDGPSEGRTIRATLRANGAVVATAEAPAGGKPAHLVLAPKTVRLWEPLKPFLYALTYEIRQGGRTVDKVESQAGLRSVKIDGRSVLINGKRVFQRLVLDQGFYPDGVWTAPSDAELKADIQRSIAAGFNGARLHQKTFEPRFLYWADKLGYMVWGEYPSYGMRYADPRLHRPVMDEWAQIVERDRNHPAIVGWCPFNETEPGAVPFQNSTARMTWALDRTRPTLDTSGWTHGLPEAQLSDAHDYESNAQVYYKRWMDNLSGAGLPARYGSGVSTEIPFFISEFGGIGYNAEGGWGYGGTPKSEAEYFTRLNATVKALTDNPNLFGFCYTQLTDVEQEKNGVYYYDRRPKFDLAKFRAAFSQPSAYELRGPTPPVKPQEWDVLVGSARDDNAQPWEYTMTEPTSGWQTATGGWQTGLGGFGAEVGEIKTPWTTKDLWIRQKFHYDGASFNKAMLVIFYDNAAEVYVNGKPIWSARPETWNGGYEGQDVTATLKAALKPGENTIAAHVHQDTGGQFIDMALLTTR